jgi:hypothetical protein
MWTCKRCETLNEDEHDSCALCNEPKAVKEEQQRTSNNKNFNANKQQFSQNQQSFGANNSQKEADPRKKNPTAILIGALCVLLLVAVIVIVVLITRQPAYQSAPQITEPPAGPMETMAPQADANQNALIPVNEDHRIVVDSIYDSVLDGSFRWGAAIDQAGTVWLWDQNDYVARPSDITDAVAIYTAGVDWSARLFVVKKDGSVWWSELYWENNTPQYGFQKISGLENITDLEILDSIDLGLFALDAQGRVWVYGHGEYGVFGMGTDEDNYLTPVVKGLPPIQKIQCIYEDGEPGYSMVVAQATSGEFYYWGTNLFTNGYKTYNNAQSYLDIETASSNWSLFWSLEGNGHASIACLDEQGHLSIYKDSTNPIDYSDSGTFILQRGGIRSFYLLDENGSVYGYGDYSSGVSVTEDYQNTSRPSYIKELSDNQSIATIAFGGWETTALYQDGRIGVWGQTDAYVSDAQFIQDESGNEFKLMTTVAKNDAEPGKSEAISFGDVMLRVETTSEYTVRLIPTNERLETDKTYMEGITFDSDTLHVSIDDCTLVNSEGTGGGIALPGAKVQLINDDTKQEWEKTLDSGGGADAFTSLPSGHYRYIVSKEGYVTYSSPVFELNYSEGKENDYAWISCSLMSEEAVFSNGFEIQLTDLAGNAVISQKFAQILISPCQNDSVPFEVRSMLVMGNATGEDGQIISDWSQHTLYAMRKGSSAIITFDDSITWSGSGIAAPYILIRAE